MKSPLNPPHITALLRSQSPEKENFMSELGSHTHVLTSEEPEGVSGPSMTSTEGVLPSTQTHSVEGSFQI